MSKWKPYQPTKFDLERSPELAEEKQFEWKGYRDFKKKERELKKLHSPDYIDDACYRNFRR